MGRVACSKAQEGKTEVTLWRVTVGRWVGGDKGT